MRRGRACTIALTLLLTLVGVCGTGSPPPADARATERTWLALGDSYSSGEGTSGTQRPSKGEPECARATGFADQDGTASYAKAWPAVAYDQVRTKGNFTHQDFYACTGNITDDIYHQISEARSKSGRESWDVVSLGFGGNNIDFTGILYDCLEVPAAWDLANFVPGCDINQKTISARIRRLVDSSQKAPGFVGTITLGQAYDRAAQVVKPGGQVIVAGYPQLFDDPSNWALARTVVPVCDALHAADVPQLRRAGTELNNTIRDAVRAANTRWAPRGVRFRYADFANQVYETATGHHGRCTGSPWINGFTTGVTNLDFRLQRSFHPTAEGHANAGAYVASLVADGLDHPAKPVTPARRMKLFTTPSGNIRCAVFNLSGTEHTSGFRIPDYGETEDVGCVINEHNYEPQPSDCNQEGVYLDQLGRTGRTTVRPCSGDYTLRLYGVLLPDRVTPTKVAYNTVVDLDAARCTVTGLGVRCVNRSGHGFRLSRETNERF